MVIAALVSFGVLFVAWILAPDGRTPEPQITTEGSEALPIAA